MDGKYSMSFHFLHTADWQLGMTRYFFSEGVQERFAQSRFDAIHELGRIAEEENCQFMMGCGDVFESNMVDRKIAFQELIFDWNNLISATKDDDFGTNYKDNKSGIQVNDYDNIFNPIIDNVENYFDYTTWCEVTPKTTIFEVDNQKAKKTITCSQTDFEFFNYVPIPDAL